jgi:ATP-dependent exoDNAse (exonuclease V) alpha subunit
VANNAVQGSISPIATGDRVVFLRNDHDEQIFNGTIATVTSVTQGVDEGHDNLIIDAVDNDAQSLDDFMESHVQPTGYHDEWEGDEYE